MTYEIDNLKINSISEWMKEIEKVCQELKREELPKNKEEYDHVIELIQETILSSSLILTRSKKQEIIKTYLNDILRKE